MNKISKETLIPLGLVIAACATSYKAGSLQFKYDSFVTEVQAMKAEQKKVDENTSSILVKILERLAAIETALKMKKE